MNLDGFLERRSPGALIGVLVVATGLRLWGVVHDLPFSYFGDELHLMKRAMAMGTGDLNPHWFHKPAFLMYLLLGGYGSYFAFGWMVGLFHSTDEFAAHFLANTGPFLLIGRLIVLSSGVATVYVVYRLGRLVSGRASGGLAGALVAAVMVPMVAGSQHIKEDVPAGFLLALSLLAYLGTRDSARLRPLVWAALLAGASAGTKYYGVVLLPGFGLLELWRGLSGRASWRAVAGRSILLAVLFGTGFFVTSPYHVLDPTARSFVLNPQGAEQFAEDQGSLGPEPRPWYGPVTHFLGTLVTLDSLGLPLALLAALGFAAVWLNPRTRAYGVLVGVPLAGFVGAAVTIAAYHAEPRHLNAIYPLLATLVWPGAALLAGLVGSPRSVAAVALAIVVAASIPSAGTAIVHDREVVRLDSRGVAYRWVVKELPREARILLDDYGPPVNPNSTAAARMRTRLAGLEPGPYTLAQGTRLRLLSAYPPEDGRDIDELGHQWWTGRELSDLELSASAYHRDMGNPLISRQPKSVSGYRAEGVRFVVTNSAAKSRYRTDQARNAFPSFARFYAGLEQEATLIKTIDPDAWNGKGPLIWIYDLAPSEPSGPAGIRADGSARPDATSLEEDRARSPMAVSSRP
jgi:hypothetical protein